MTRKNDLTPDGRLDPLLLHAFADGELEPEDAARVVMHLADCPQDQARVDAIMALNQQLARACEGPMHEPVPAAIHATIRAAMSGPRGSASAAHGRVATKPRFWHRFAPRQGWPVLAGVLAGALAAALVGVVVLMPRSDAPVLALGPVPAHSPMAEALDDLVSGQTRLVAPHVELAMTASFALKGGYCREFALRHDEGGGDLAALACSVAGGWQIAARQAAPPSVPATGYVPAGQAVGDAIGAELDARDVGLALDAAAEVAARRAGWR